MSKDTIRAAGGVLWRWREGHAEYALVHRTRYDDWSLPKGKLEAGEAELAAAVREVGEETGSSVAVSRRLDRIGYEVNGVPKTVAFWLMRYTGGEFAVNDEVDEVRWLSIEQARAQLTYDVERDVLVDATRLPIPESVVVLVRHARAGRRSEWDGCDDDRPLDAKGTRQAAHIARFGRWFGPDQVVSARPMRCVQTVTPLAYGLGLATSVDPVFDDERYTDDARAAEHAVTALASPGSVSVISSQGATIPGLIAAFAPHVADTVTKKGAAWVLTFVDGAVVTADYYTHPGR